MLRTAILAPIALAPIALALAGRGYDARPQSAALALAPSLAVDECIQVNPRDTFEVSIYVGGVTNLMAWDIYYAYDRRIVEVVDRDVVEFLNQNPNSRVLDFSDPVPSTTGLYRVAGADTGGVQTAEDGGGVLAVLTLRARDEGVSWSSLAPGDVNHDDVPDYGPTLTETGGEHIGDTDGDGIFDEDIRAGQIAVGRPCREPAPTPYVDPGVLPVDATVSTPAVATGSTPAVANPTDEPDGSNPETVTPVASASPPGAEQPSPTRRTPPGSQSGSGDDSGGGLSPLLAAVLGAGGGAAIIASYVFFRALRRPA